MPELTHATNVSLTQRIKGFFSKEDDLPIRDFELNLAPTPRVKSKNKPELSVSSIESSFKELGENPADILEQVTKDLRQLNSYPIAQKKRLELTTVYWHKIYRAVQALTQKHKRSGVIPEGAQRVKDLSLSFDALAGIHKYYQILFMHDYALTGKAYLKAQEQLLDSSFRILEIVLLQQKIKALGYRQLPAKSWQSVNTIFYVMEIYENDSIDIEQSTTQSLIEPKGAQVKENLKDLYRRIQLLGYLDLLRYPVHQHTLLEDYIAPRKEEILLSRLEQIGELKADTLVVGRDQEQSPVLQAKILKKQIPGMLIGLKALKVNLQMAQQGLFNPENRKNTAFLKLLKINQIPSKEITPLVDTLHGKVTEALDINIKGTREKVDLVLYSSFKDCYVLKTDDKLSQEKRESSLRNQLAARSSFIAGNDEAEIESLWYSLFQDEQTLLLQTQETRFTIPMSVGCLIAFAPKGKDVVKHTMAYVNRLERLGNKLINIELKIITDHAESVTITIFDEMSEEDSQKQRPGLLINQDGEWQVIVHNSYVNQRISKVTMKRDVEQFELSLGRCIMAKSEFSVFHLEGSATANFSPLFERSLVQESTDSIFG